MNARLKLSARSALTGSQSKAVPLVGAVIILMLFFSVCNALVNLLPISVGEYSLLIFNVLSLFVTIAAVSPLRLIFQIRLLLLARRINPVQKLNIGVSGVLKSCEMSICLFFIKLFWFAVFELVPISLSVVFFVYYADSAVSLRAAFSFFEGMFVLAVAGAGFFFLFIQRYSKSFFYLACYKDFTVTDAIVESIRKTKGRLAEILFFKLSFLPWFVLCVGIFPMLYVVPYYKQSLTCLFLSR